MYVFGFNVSSVLIRITFNITLCVFVTLTKTMDDVYIKIVFGPGAVRKRFPLKDIAS